MINQAEDIFVCRGCRKPIVAGESRYAGAEHRDEFWHYRCWAGTAEGASSIERQHQAKTLTKPRSRKAQLDAKGGKDEHCPDGFLCNGWRLVRKGGIVFFGHGRHHHETLEAMVGEYVYCQISDWTGVEITVYPYGLAGRDREDGCLFPVSMGARNK